VSSAESVLEELQAIAAELDAEVYQAILREEGILAE
jgi:hypothetical protein